MSLEGLLVGRQQCVDELKQLHHSLVLTEVLVTFEEEHVLTAITPGGGGAGGGGWGGEERGMEREEQEEGRGRMHIHTHHDSHMTVICYLKSLSEVLTWNKPTKSLIVTILCFRAAICSQRNCARITQEPAGLYIDWVWRGSVFWDSSFVVSAGASIFLHTICLSVHRRLDPTFQ